MRGLPWQPDPNTMGSEVQSRIIVPMALPEASDQKPETKPYVARGIAVKFGPDRSLINQLSSVPLFWDLPPLAHPRLASPAAATPGAQTHVTQTNHPHHCNRQAVCISHCGCVLHQRIIARNTVSEVHPITLARPHAPPDVWHTRVA